MIVVISGKCAQFFGILEKFFDVELLVNELLKETGREDLKHVIDIESMVNGLYSF